MDNVKMADIIDVANMAGVSPATVSRSFNHPDMVKPETRHKIKLAIEETGYIRNRAAQAIHGKRSGTIGLIVPTLDNAIFSNLIQAFSEQLALNGFTMLVSTHGYDLGREYQLLRSLLEHRVEGVALIGVEHRDETYKLLNRRGMPTVAMWNYDESSPVPTVGTDNYKAGELLAKHVLSLGHEKIGLAFPPLAENDRANARYHGVINTLTLAGVETPKHWNLRTNYSLKGARRVGTKLISSNDFPEAIIAGNDVIAQGLIFAALAQGVRIPDDLSVCGFGDFSGSADFHPSITTVRLRSNEVGQRAAEVLSNMINDKEERLINHQFIELELKIRESTSIPRSGT